MELIDAFAHCGLSKYKPLPELERAMKHAGVARAVLVQHYGEYDNTYIGDIVAAAPYKFAGVCLVDSKKNETRHELERLTRGGKFRGVRLHMDSLEFNKAVWQEAFNLGLNIVTDDIDGVVSRLSLLKGFLNDNPTAAIFLSHMGYPNVKEAPGYKKYRSIFELSQYPNVYFQISGMGMFCPYPYQPLWPMVSQALESFGPDRMLWGGNYPIGGEEEGYVREAELIRTGGLPLPGDALGKVTRTTALRTWFLEPQ